MEVKIYIFRNEVINMYYVLYKGESIIATGTIQSIAKQLGVQVKTIQFYNTNTYKKRIRHSKNRRELIKL